jgi:Predicted metal-dependent phosphoesterases (PHP family)
MQTVRSDRVVFSKPDWNDLRERGINAADMHFHTHYSDSYTDVKKAIKLAEKRNVGFAVTDHNLIGGAVEASEVKTDVTIVPGIEISAWDGPHILVYFYDISDLKEYWKRSIKENVQRSPFLAISKDTEWILNSLEDENCVISAAHPMGYFGFNKGMQKCINKNCLCDHITSRVDAYEVICSGMSHSGNVASRRFADICGLGYTGGTDGHLMRELGNVVTCTEEQGVEGMLNSIKKRTNFIIGQEKSFPSKVEMGVVTMTQYFRYIPSSLMIHYRQNITRLRRR